MTPSNSLRFVTRAGCTLCEKAQPSVVAAAKRAGLTVEIVDVDEDPELLAVFGDRVPVVLDGAGNVLAEGRISRVTATAAVLKARLAGR